MNSRRVDDLEIAGPRKCVDQLISCIVHCFGKTKGDDEAFATRSLRQARSADGSVAMGQGEYIGALILTSTSTW